MNRLISTFFYSGLFPIAPGTMGSVLALILILPAAFVPQNLHIIISFFVLSILFGFYSIPKYLQGKTDDLQEIVIDEAAGLYLTILLAIIILRICGVKADSLAIFGLSFVFFRIFDITKPLIIGYFDRTLKGAIGIMVDDLLAGIFAAVSVSILLIAFHAFQ